MSKEWRLALGVPAASMLAGAVVYWLTPFPALWLLTIVLGLMLGSLVMGYYRQKWLREKRGSSGMILAGMEFYDLLAWDSTRGTELVLYSENQADLESVAEILTKRDDMSQIVLRDVNNNPIKVYKV